MTTIRLELTTTDEHPDSVTTRIGQMTEKWKSFHIDNTVRIVETIFPKRSPPAPTSTEGTNADSRTAKAEPDEDEYAKAIEA